MEVCQHLSFCFGFSSDRGDVNIMDTLWTGLSEIQQAVLNNSAGAMLTFDKDSKYAVLYKHCTYHTMAKLDFVWQLFSNPVGLFYFLQYWNQPVFQNVYQKCCDTAVTVTYLQSNIHFPYNLHCLCVTSTTVSVHRDRHTTSLWQPVTLRERFFQDRIVMCVCLNISVLTIILFLKNDCIVKVIYQNM